MSLAFSPDADSKVTDILARYPDEHRQAALVPVLMLARKEFGYLTTQVMDLVAERLELPKAKVINTATFYTMLYKHPVGRHHLQICKNIACFLRGSDGIFAAIRAELDLGSHETSADGAFSVEPVECLAACGSAPAMMVNETYHEQMTPERVRELVRELRGLTPGGG